MFRLIGAWILAAAVCGCAAGPARAPDGTDAVEGAGMDATSGLPLRVVHRASGITLVLVPAGSAGKESVRRFYLAETETTVRQFRRFVEATGYRTDAERGVAEQPGREVGAFAQVEAGDRRWHPGANWRDPFPNLTSPRHEVRDDHPVVQVSWNDAAAFCAHFGLRLPTDAEWEHACRAGSRARYPWGDDAAGGREYANGADAAGQRRFAPLNDLFPYDDGYATVAPAGAMRANAWGLRCMIGNVEEWCAGTYARGGGPGAARVTRGGSWVGGAGLIHTGFRAGMLPHSRRDFIGFRAALAAP